MYYRFYKIYNILYNRLKLLKEIPYYNPLNFFYSLRYLIFPFNKKIKNFIVEITNFIN